MAQCKWCERKGLFLRVNHDGLCRECLPRIQREVYANGKIIQRLEKLLETNTDIDIAVQQCEVIVKKAREVLKYEHRGIPTYTPLPSVIAAEYTKKRDKILLESRPEKVAEALEVARFALDQHRRVSSVARALEALKEARGLLNELPWGTRIASFINQKGGVGKTTTTMNIGYGLAKLGRRVLLIDLDSQANLTDGMGFDEDALKYTVYDLFKGTASLDEVMIDNSEVTLIPSSIMLTRVDDEFGNRPDAHRMLTEALKGIRGFDYVLIDCPPSLGFLTMNALTASRDVYVPLLPEYFALKGVRKVIEAVEFVKQNGNPHLTIRGVIGTRFDSRKRHHEEVIAKISESMGGKLYGVVHENISVSEASGHGKPIYDYKPRSAGADDYFNLCREILRRDNDDVLEIHNLNQKRG